MTEEPALDAPDPPPPRPAAGKRIRKNPDARRAEIVTAAREVFADRGYLPDGSLVPRSQPGALIEDEEQSLAQTLSLVRDHRVTAIDGSSVPVNAQSVCLHGDGAHALAFARRIRERLDAEGIAVRPVAGVH